VTRDRKLLLLLGAIAVIGVWFALVWMPRGNEIAAAETRVEAADLRAEELQLELQRLVSAERDDEASDAALDRVTAAIPDTADLAGLITGVNATATEAGVQLLGVTPAALTAGTPTVVPFSLDVTGGYFSVVSFTQKLTALPRLIVIDSLQVSAADRGALTVKFAARAFTTQAVAS
jgi:Tfp pilus assembly protein PilO